MEIKNIAVIGSGTMGNGIAHVLAVKGYRVALMDVESQMLNRAIKTISANLDRQIARGYVQADDKERILSHISTYTVLNDAVSNIQLVIEAITENTERKLKLFHQLDAIAPPEAILASNTSSISITQIAGATARSDKVIGMHFMNPVPVMKLVEIIRGFDTGEETVRIIKDLAVRLDKVPVEVKDYPGFVSNRILMPMINESIMTLHEGVAGVEEIDTIMKLGMSHPMGPLQLADFIGLDICLSILKVMHEGFGNPRYAPCPLLINMVRAGHLGKKSGSGFYQYNTEGKLLGVSPCFLKH